MNGLKTNRGFIIGFVAIETLLLYFILFQQLGLPSGVLHYLSIVVAWAFALIQFKQHPETRWLRIGLTWTIAADFFLTLLGTQQILGTVLFLLAQVCYWIYFRTQEKNPRQAILIWMFLTMTSILVFFAIFSQTLDLLMVIAVIYYMTLWMNWITSLTKFRRYFPLGIAFLFYLFCDTLVGLSQSAPYAMGIIAEINEWIQASHFNWIWFFYLPSQVLIALFSVKHREVVDEGNV